MKIFNFLPLFLLFFRVFYDLASRQFHSKYLTKGAPKLGYSIQYFNNVIFYILYIHLSYIFSLFTTKTVRPASRRTWVSNVALDNLWRRSCIRDNWDLMSKFLNDISKLVDKLWLIGVFCHWWKNIWGNSRHINVGQNQGRV